MMLSQIPRVAAAEYDYATAKDHAAMLDMALGFRCEQIEAELLAKKQHQGLRAELGIHHEVQDWVGLPLQTLQTPYIELLSLLDLLNPTPMQQVIDLGCAYGRLGLVLGEFFPLVKFTGFELVPERVAEANRVIHQLQFQNAIVLTQDLTASDFLLPEADYYFLYDYGGLRSIQKTLLDLQAISRSRPLVVIARGKGCRHEILQQHPWLAQINPPQHHPNFSIFYS